MRITSVEKWQVVVPCKPGVVEREGRWHDAVLSVFDRFPKWIVRIHADNGLEGVGESLRKVGEDGIDAGTEAILGKDPRRFPLHQLPLPQTADYTTFEMALFDLLGKTWEVPAYQLLGGARQERVAVDYWASRHSPEETARHAATGLRQGFGSIKLKMALASEAAGIAEDDPVVETVAAISEACGPGFAVTIDPNYRFNDRQRTLDLARELARFNVLALEEPMPWSTSDLDDYVALRRDSPIPLAIHVRSPEEILPVLKREAADYLNIDGTMADFVKMAWMAERAGVSCWHGSTVGLGIRDMSYVHASFAAASCTLPGDMVGNFLREDDLIEEPIPIDGGFISLPLAPGLGVTLDEAALARYRLD